MYFDGRFCEYSEQLINTLVLIWLVNLLWIWLANPFGFVKMEYDPLLI